MTGVQTCALPISYNNMAVVHEEKGEYDRALEFYNSALRIRRATLGPEHPDTAMTWHNMAHLFLCRGDVERSLEHFQLAHVVFVAKLGAQHPYMQAAARGVEAALARMRLVPASAPRVPLASRTAMRVVAVELNEMVVFADTARALFGIIARCIASVARHYVSGGR